VPDAASSAKPRVSRDLAIAEIEREVVREREEQEREVVREREEQGAVGARLRFGGDGRKVDDGQRC
jgi:hypothetical protein